MGAVMELIGPVVGRDMREGDSATPRRRGSCLRGNYGLFQIMQLSCEGGLGQRTATKIMVEKGNAGWQGAGVSGFNISGGLRLLKFTKEMKHPIKVPSQERRWLMVRCSRLWKKDGFYRS